jgi:hypothetical protein
LAQNELHHLRIRMELRLLASWVRVSGTASGANGD